MDYHLAPEPVPAPHVSRSRVQVTRVSSDIIGNVTAHLWQSVYLRCTVTGFVQGKDLIQQKTDFQCLVSFTAFEVQK